MEEMVLRTIEHYGYFALFGTLVMGLIGLPVPDEFLLTFSGFLVSMGRMNWIVAVLVASAGSAIGMTVSFWIGHRFGLPLLENYGRKIHMTPERVMRVELWFTRFGRFAVPIGYFIPGVRHLTAYFTGLSKWSYRTFLLYASLGALAWSTAFISIGVLVGHRWREVTLYLHKYMLAALVLLVLGAGVWWIVHRRSKIKAERE
ncbi:DedA family protein [Tumebacillus sp. ITR2]|uniref:DedA family protein n=1 Tax=Tumebacillus amylolyticus TaxID=2801339 RepID=A0ABS1JFT6_9BACL|nr:DedA family protein [Tumebacillus amylolyticus]MBL0389112.1 DedA family protein [Tumebacillus amylolyticus]